MSSAALTTGRTPVEVVVGAPEGRITRADVSVAKNHLGEGEMQALERIVPMYLDYADNQATGRIAMRMQDWVGDP
jgi:hypothetical protein